MPHQTGNVTVRMPVKTQEKLDKIAGRLDRSRNWLVNQAVEQYLELYDWQTERIRARLQEAENGGEFLSHDEAMQELESKAQARLKA